MRRTQNKNIPELSQSITYKTITLDIQRFQGQVNQQLVELTPVEFRLLVTLAKKPGIVFSRDSLMHTCYEDDRIVSSLSIDNHMKNLRSKLAQTKPEIDLLHSVYGIGYKIE